MKEKQFTKLEQAGIIVAIIVIATFIYLRFLGDSIEKRQRRIERNWIQLTNEIKDLKAKTGNRNFQNSIQRLKRKATRVKKELNGMEIYLADGEEVGAIANEIVRVASECRLRIEKFSPIVELGSSSNEKKGSHERKHYRILLKGKFGCLVKFIEKIDQLPKLIIVENIDVLRIENEKFIKADINVVI